MSEETEPLVRVVRGNPTDDELAALTTVIVAKAAATAEARAPQPRPSTWAAYWRSVRPQLRPGPGAWRASGLPT
ncbi:acyl-CoA carboxylase subunit epsilon [Actinobacteria bacterium YIM 96077]|uniref:Acyl-CoA carboxylase subunit epsilon n=1 Tax=Phytoactinopolyspora halophila TaxID=1981511 RepID=A0A329QHL8_9ACTN|nr:acyl-CoA carboxylase subunit epsilon [Phytoactinopolyspora halophila]AYY14405.1 acyl-CoA carboxylase subunit epsilon [Actinobacteria bacterium YIM 96077]RAW11874.1 acyl-CoA carboxylase subunit epsilon [Phytoactinopolyspora halophila]